MTTTGPPARERFWETCCLPGAPAGRAPGRMLFGRALGGARAGQRLTPARRLPPAPPAPSRCRSALMGGLGDGYGSDGSDDMWGEMMHELACQGEHRWVLGARVLSASSERALWGRGRRAPRSTDPSPRRHQALGRRRGRRPRLSVRRLRRLLLRSDMMQLGLRRRGAASCVDGAAGAAGAARHAERANFCGACGSAFCNWRVPDMACGHKNWSPTWTCAHETGGRRSVDNLVLRRGVSTLHPVTQLAALVTQPAAFFAEFSLAEAEEVAKGARWRRRGRLVLSSGLGGARCCRAEN